MKRLANFTGDTMKYIFYTFLVFVIVAISAVITIAVLLILVVQNPNRLPNQPYNVPTPNDLRAAVRSTTTPMPFHTPLSLTPNFTATQAANNTRATQTVIADRATQTMIAMRIEEKRADMQATQTRRAAEQTIAAHVAQATATYLDTAPRREQDAVAHQQRIEGLLIGGSILLVLLLTFGFLMYFKTRAQTRVAQLEIERLRRAEALAAQETERFNAQTRVNQQNSEQAWVEPQRLEQAAIQEQMIACNIPNAAANASRTSPNSLESRVLDRSFNSHALQNEQAA